LFGDPRLGSEAMARFMPSRFTAAGNARDASGIECKDVACPNCHLRLPRAVVDHKPCLISIAGSPSSGKSFFLATMAWQARRVMPQQFNIDFADADAEFNRVITSYENQLFYVEDPNQIVTLSKTQETGDLYNAVRFGQMTVTLPQPIMFSAVPSHDHPRLDRARRGARLVCWYDNAGESFQPGKDTASNAVTQHLGAAHAWMFCYDMTQDPHVREKLDALGKSLPIRNAVTYRQVPLFFDMLIRIRKHANLDGGKRTKRPLMIICTKYDCWSALSDSIHLESPYAKTKSGIPILDRSKLQRVSLGVRRLLKEFAPDLVSSAESFSENVFYIPISAIGPRPDRTDSDESGFRSGDIRPIWSEVPLMLALAYNSPRLLGISM
jgi:hypothetical protein